MPESSLVPLKVRSVLPDWGWLLLGIAYLLPGIFGHDPWKPDEAYIFGGVYHLLKTGDWIVPYLGGEPFMEKPPLFHLVAALLGKLTAPMLPLPDGARLASVFFVALALIAIAYAARTTWGRGFGRHAVLVALASLGLTVHAHMMLPDLPLMSGVALALAGFAAGAHRLRRAGFLVGTGAGMAFLGKGLLGPGVIAITAVLLPLLFREWRHRAYGNLLWLATLSALPWLVIWPVALYQRSPDLFQIWFWDNNIGRFFGFSVSHLGAENEAGFFWRTVPWFLFPGWVFAAIVPWQLRLNALRHPAVQIGGTFLLVMCLTLAFSASARAVYFLPMIMATALLGAGSAAWTVRWIDRPLAVIGVLIGIAAIALFWSVWGTMVMGGHAPAWPWLLRWLPADFAMPISPVEIAAAVALTIGIAVAIAKALPRANSGLLVWTFSLVLTWGLANTLWLPWFDSARSYRATFESLAKNLPRNNHCISSRGLGEGERAMLEYLADLRTQRDELAGPSFCPTILVESKGNITPPPDQGWHLVWSGARAGETRESFQLYQFEIPKTAQVTGTHRRHKS